MLIMLYYASQVKLRAFVRRKLVQKWQPWALHWERKSRQIAPRPGGETTERRSPSGLIMPEPEQQTLTTFCVSPEVLPLDGSACLTTRPVAPWSKGDRPTAADQTLRPTTDQPTNADQIGMATLSVSRWLEGERSPTRTADKLKKSSADAGRRQAWSEDEGIKKVEHYPENQSNRFLLVNGVMSSSNGHPDLLDCELAKSRSRQAIALTPVCRLLDGKLHCELSPSLAETGDRKDLENQGNKKEEERSDDLYCGSERRRSQEPMTQSELSSVLLPGEPAG